jgi:hypothetical protein
VGLAAGLGVDEVTRIVEATVLSVESIDGVKVVTVRAPGYGTLAIGGEFLGLAVRPGDVRALAISLELGGLIRHDERANLEHV